MAATSVQLAPTNATDAEFRAWCQAIHDQMVLGGWINTADTGQIDLATVVKPAATNTSQGYKIYRSNDAGGGLTEFYLKVEFGSGGATANPAIWITVGWATNGAGTLTGVTSTRTQIGSITTGAVSSSTTFWSNLSSAPGRVTHVLFSGSSSGFCFSVERLRNAAFAQTNDLLILGYYIVNAQFGMTNQVISTTLAYTLYNTGTSGGNYIPALQANVIQANAVVSGLAGMSLQFGQKGGLTAPSENVFGGVVATLGGAQTNDIKITSFGTERNYIISASTPNFNAATTPANATLLVTRFE